MRRLSPSILLILIGSCSPSITRGDEFGNVRRLIHDRMNQENIPSVVVGVSRGNEVLWTEAFGHSDLEQQVVATIDTAYRIGSTTKPLTATAVMMLVERGELDLDRHINDYVPDAKLELRIGNISKATLGTVVRHMSGLPSHWQTFFPDETEQPPPIELLISRYGKFMIKPGLWFNYSNLGYEILADVVSRKTGTPFDEYLRQEVFLPLGMERTALAVDELPLERCAVGYRSDGERVPHIRTATPAAGDAYSTVGDLLRFGMFHMKLPLESQSPILQNQTLDMMQQSTVPMGNEQYGYGWHVRQDIRGRTHVLHGGAHVGWECHFEMIPQERLCVVVLANRDTKWPGYRVCLETADRIFATLLDCSVEEVQPQGGHDLGLPSEDPNGLPGKLAGEWLGTIETYEREIPIRLLFQSDGDVHSKLDGQLAALVNEARFDDDVFSGKMIGDIGTKEANRRQYVLEWDLTYRDGKLSGILHAMGADRRGSTTGRGLLLGHWAELSPVGAAQAPRQRQDHGQDADN